MLDNQIKFKLTVEVQVFLEDHENLKKSPTVFDVRLVSKAGDFFQSFWPSYNVLTLYVVRNNGVRESGNEEMLKDKRLESSNRHLCFLGQFNDYDTKWG